MTRRVISLCLAVVLLVTSLLSVACDSALDWTKKVSTEVRVELASAPSIVDAFAAHGLISAEEATAKKASVRRISDSYSPLDEKIQSLQAFDAQTALELLPLAEAFVRTLDAEGVIKLPDNAEVAARYRDISLVLQTLGTRLLSRVKSKASGAKQSSIELRREREETERDIEQLRQLVSAA
jgi:hypothetical protein